MGESVTEGTVTGWRKRVGEAVTSGEPIVDVTTDKVDVEVPAPASGTLVKIIAQEGDNVRVGAPLGEIDVSGGDGAGAKNPQTQREPARQEPRPVREGSAAVPTSPQTVATPKSAPRASASADASPLAKRAAARNGIDLATIHGSGPGGIIRRTDIINGQSATRPADGDAQATTPAPSDEAQTPKIDQHDGEPATLAPATPVRPAPPGPGPKG